MYGSPALGGGAGSGAATRRVRGSPTTCVSVRRGREAHWDEGETVSTGDEADDDEGEHGCEVLMVSGHASCQGGEENWCDGERTD